VGLHYVHLLRSISVTHSNAYPRNVITVVLELDFRVKWEIFRLIDI